MLYKKIMLLYYSSNAGLDSLLDSYEGHKSKREHWIVHTQHDPGDFFFQCVFCIAHLPSLMKA